MYWYQLTTRGITFLRGLFHVKGFLNLSTHWMPTMWITQKQDKENMWSLICWQSCDGTHLELSFYDKI